VVALEVQPFLSPRYLRMHGWVSDIIDPQRSIVAGSAHGGKLAKVYLGPILAKAHINYTHAGLWTFVDDTVARTEGEPTQVAKDLTAVGTILCDGMTKAELRYRPRPP